MCKKAKMEELIKEMIAWKIMAAIIAEVELHLIFLTQFKKHLNQIH